MHKGRLLWGVAILGFAVSVVALVWSWVWFPALLSTDPRMDFSDHSRLVYTFEVPDPAHPIPPEQRGVVGPSGQLIPFVPAPLDAGSLIGCRIDEVSPIVGTYGMGGPGFFGFRLGEEWLVIAIWGAGDWVRADGRLITDYWHAKQGRPEPWIGAHGDTFGPQVAGQTIASFELGRHNLRMELSNGIVIEIEPDAASRPRFIGNGAERRFLESDNLRKAVFLSPTAELWI